jgi:hypothetical protein
LVHGKNIPPENRLAKLTARFQRKKIPHVSSSSLLRLKMETQMSDFDVQGFVAEMERLGLHLSAVPLADGKYRVNRWRTMGAAEHSQQRIDLWTSQIGNDPARMDQLAAHLSQGEPRVIANRIFPGLHEVK